jgi:methionine-gamma-lyase
MVMKKKLDPSKFKPESLMMSHGYDPMLSEGALKCPIFQTSTFVFHSAEEGKAFFEVATGQREKKPKEELGLIYSRLNNPDLEILEDRLTLWDGAEAGAVFESGMSAISTILMEFLSPGDLLLFSSPLYGGTDHFIKHVLTRFQIEIAEFKPGDRYEDVIEIIEASGKADRLAMIYVETPGNPTNALIDLEMVRKISEAYSSTEKKVLVSVDNTFLGPLWQHPLQLGADLVIYSATKYIGGHSDVIAGACLGSRELIGRIKSLRSMLGNMAGPWTGWLLMRSLETLKARMEVQMKNAQVVAKYLDKHSLIERVHYLGLLSEKDGEEYEIFKKQCLSPGAMISFDIKGGEQEAFLFLNNLRLIKLAVSLGSTESLAEHPASMTHSDVDPEEKRILKISDNLIRLSIGVEDPDDLIWDIEQALSHVQKQIEKPLYTN